MTEQETRDGREAKSGDATVSSIGRGRAQAGDQPYSPAFGERAANTKDAYRPDWGRNREPDRETF